MKKIIPAVWFQNKRNPASARAARMPVVLERLESQLARVAGGIGPRDPIITYDSQGHPSDVID
jgi:hypothetical protein